MNKSLVLVLFVAAIVFSACKKKKDTLPIPYESLTATTGYFNTFKGADSATTVSLTNPTLRINMLREIEENLLAFGTNYINGTKLKNMLNNTYNSFADSTLNKATDISILSATAQSFSADKRQMEFDRINSWVDSVAVAGIAAHKTASVGAAGTIGGNYLVSSNGFEYTQFIKNGIIGAMMFDQVCNICLGAEKMAADNTTPVAGKNYTALEHTWDEAYGYLTSNEYYPKQNNMGAWQEIYLGNYVRQVGSFYGNTSALYLAFLKGRAAIVNKDNTTRDQQVAAIRTNLEKAIATLAVSYLNKSKNALSEATRFHSLSEGIGFIYALRYAHNAKVPATKSDEMMNSLTSKPNGFWSLPNTDIDLVRDQIAATFVVDRDAIVNP